MKLIPTHVHGAFDYICGFALMLSPYVFGFSEPYGSESVIPQLVGLFILIQSLMTRYECGVLRVLSMNTHLLNESLAALFLAVSPWVFGFHQAPSGPWLIHSCLGLLILTVSLITGERRHPLLRPAF